MEPGFSLESQRYSAALPENVCSLRELRTEAPQEFGDGLVADGRMLPNRERKRGPTPVSLVTRKMGKTHGEVCNRYACTWY